MPKLFCKFSDNLCPSGYSAISGNLDGSGKRWANDTQTIDACASICNVREDCIGFAFAVGNSKTSACITYTIGNSSNINDKESLRSDPNWRSCIKSSNGRDLKTLLILNHQQYKTG